MTLPRKRDDVRRPMLVLFVRVTNRDERPIRCVLSSASSLLLPTFASEREREANKYFYSIFCSHIRILTLSLRLFSLTHSGNGQTPSLLNCTTYFFSPFLLSLCFSLSLVRARASLFHLKKLFRIYTWCFLSFILFYRSNYLTFLANFSVLTQSNNRQSCRTRMKKCNAPN